MKRDRNCSIEIISSYAGLWPNLTSKSSICAGGLLLQEARGQPPFKSLFDKPVDNKFGGTLTAGPDMTKQSFGSIFPPAKDGGNKASNIFDVPAQDMNIFDKMQQGATDKKVDVIIDNVKGNSRRILDTLIEIGNCCPGCLLLQYFFRAAPESSFRVEPQSTLPVYLLQSSKKEPNFSAMVKGACRVMTTLVDRLQKAGRL